MPDFRCFYDNAVPAIGAEIELSPDESNHLVAANRARPGSLVRVFNGNGLEWDATLLKADKRRARLKVTDQLALVRPLPEIALALAVPKGKLIESIIRKATEIGVQRVFPITTQRTEAKIDRKKQSSKNAKWTAAAIEGAKQSGNPFVAEIEPLADYPSFLKQSDRYGLRLVASLADGSDSLDCHIRALASPPRNVVWLVGPEGDFTEEETAQAIAAGFLPTRLGPYVLRCDTAALYAASITQHAFIRSHR